MTRQSSPAPVNQPSGADQTAADTARKFDIAFYHAWCKACGICMAFCPKKIIRAEKNGKPEILDPDKCVGCRFCEMHCPDFAITVSERKPKRRRGDV